MLTAIQVGSGNEKLIKMTSMLTATQPIHIRARSFFTFALSPELPLENWLNRFDDLVAQSTDFFLHRPVVLDVSNTQMDRNQLWEVVDQLAKRKVRIMGVEGASPSFLTSDLPPAMDGGLTISNTEASGIDDSTNLIQYDETVADDAHQSEVTVGPIRSGQSFVSQGDVTIVGSVASGAEVIANGSIHIYGSLRGRVFAGSTGRTSARVFCRKLEAELIAISGYCLTSEDLAIELHDKPVQFWLNNDSIVAETLC